jgi:anion exchange protein
MGCVMLCLQVFQKHPLLSIEAYNRHDDDIINTAIDFINGTMGNNSSDIFINGTMGNNSSDIFINGTMGNNSSDIFINGTMGNNSSDVVPKPAGGIANQPNTALLTLILTLGTFGLAYYLRFFRNGHYLGRTARRALGDFGIPIAILVFVLIDYGIKDTYTEKLDVPDGLQPTDASKRGWFINPMGVNRSLPIWAIFFAVIPALIDFILIFIETQIVNVIVNKPERKLQKGSGFHFDTLLIGIFCLMSGFIGFPMMGVAAVRSITHINALSVYSNTNAPGEKPRLVHVYEQRVTIVLAHLIMGFTTLIGPVLRQVPLAVLFGVFLYMGVASMSGVQFFERIECLFKPVKYHPNEPYVQHVRTWKMNVFTLIQFLCLAVLWTIKSTMASLAFPFVLILTVPLRRYLLPYVFSDEELMYLDQTGAIKKNNDSDDDMIDDDLDFYEESKMSNIRSRRPTLPSEASAAALAIMAGNGLGVEANNTSAPTITVSHA